LEKADLEGGMEGSARLVVAFFGGNLKRKRARKFVKERKKHSH
jgi:hypothetical protein